jgi:mannose-6-phosphate isomerase-like protein (cupin superfamily)
MNHSDNPNEVMLDLPSAAPRDKVFSLVEAFLVKNGFAIVDKDVDRPWGGFFVIDEEQARRFSHFFFPKMEVVLSQMVGKISPKILMVEPGKRLSWQYHFRRAEIWKLVAGKAGVVRSATDEQGHVEPLELGKVVELPKGLRHRLVGLEDSWGMIAEIWQHTDPDRPSNEDDIVRLQDDFGR